MRYNNEGNHTNRKLRNQNVENTQLERKRACLDSMLPYLRIVISHVIIFNPQNEEYRFIL